MGVEQTEISSAFPFAANYIDVLDSSMYYVEQGEGDPILFIHGIPTSSYLWRNVIPTVANQGRCIAVDLIGMGESAKPDIEYSVFDHIRYLEAFIETLDLKNITLVMHGWGSVIGFDYAMRYPNNIKGLVFYESHVRATLDWDMLALPVKELNYVRGADDGGKHAIMEDNYFIEEVLPSGILRTLGADEKAHYATPFKEVSSRQPIWQYFKELPIGDEKNSVVDLIDNYSNKLLQSKLPKLMLYAVPGFITTIATVQWVRDNMNAVTTVDIGDGLHYAQESNPQLIAEEINGWLQKL